MAEATQEMIALANSIREEFWPDFDNAVLAAIQATTERAAQFIDARVKNGYPCPAMLRELSEELRANAHLKEQSA